MQSEDLRAFLAVVEHRSLTEAARSLGVPKSTVSRRLTRLERDLGAQLVLRTSRRLQVSELGIQLHRSSAPALANLDEIADTLRDQNRAPAGLLRVSAPEDLTTAFVGRLCGELLRRHRRLVLKVTGANQPADLLADGVDVALRIHFAPLAAVHSLVVRRLGVVEVALYASPRYLASSAPLHGPDGLRAQRCLAMASVGTGWKLTHRPSGRTERVSVAAAMISNDHHALRDAACADAGIAILPAFLAQSAVADGHLSRVLPEWSLRTATLSMIWPSSRQRSARVRAFIEHTTAFFAKQGTFAAQPGDEEAPRLSRT